MGVLRESTFEDLLSRHRAHGRRLAYTGTIETTYRCNLACAHCYVNQPAGSREEREREMPTDRLLRLVDEIVDEGCLELLFTGGEVLVRPDFETVYRHARARGLLVTLFTNGTLVTDRIADLLAAEPPLSVEISLYGMTAETYERVTQVPGSFEKCREGIRRLVERKVPLKLKTMALEWNAHEVAAMAEYAASLGLEFRFDTHLNARVDCGADRNRELQVGARRAAELTRASAARLAELKEFCEKHVVPVRPEDDPRVYSCGAGDVSFTIDPYGRLQMCQLARKSAFDLQAGTFAEGWQRFFPVVRARPWQTAAPCRACALKPMCGSCPGAAELEHGNPEGLVRHFCEIAHAEAFLAMGAVPDHVRDASCCTGRLPEATAPAPVLVQLQRRRA
jgi:radical SAM protein with 4Fe4S-binding SPASM domain